MSVRTIKTATAAGSRGMPRRSMATGISGATISQIAERFGVSLRTLRFYEERGLVRPIRRGSARLYTERDMARIELIMKGRTLGFTLAQIADLIGTATTRSPSAVETEPPVRGSLVDLLSKNEIQQQLQLLLRQRSDVDDALAMLTGIVADAGRD